MKNTKSLFTSILVLTIALFASVQTSAMEQRSYDPLNARIIAIERTLVKIGAGNVLIDELETSVGKHDKKGQERINDLKSRNEHTLNRNEKKSKEKSYTEVKK